MDPKRIYTPPQGRGMSEEELRLQHGPYGHQPSMQPLQYQDQESQDQATQDQEPGMVEKFTAYWLDFFQFLLYMVTKTVAGISPFPIPGISKFYSNYTIKPGYMPLHTGFGLLVLGIVILLMNWLLMPIVQFLVTVAGCLLIILGAWLAVKAAVKR